MGKIVVHHSGKTWSAHCKGSPTPEVSGTNRSAVRARAKAMCKGGVIHIKEKKIDIRAVVEIPPQAAKLITIKR